MTIDSIEQYFLDESSELLQTIEQNLLELLEEKSVDKVHTLMRSAHTIKGSAANYELKTLETIAHHLEDVFQALYPPELEIDSELSFLLLEGYDCLKIPLTAILSNVPYDEQEILDRTAEIFAKLQTKLGDFFGRETPLPTSEELGFDVVGLIFADSVPQDLQQLETAIATQDPEQVYTVLNSKADFFQELGVSYELPGLVDIAQATKTAMEHHKDHVLTIAKIALENFQQAYTDVLAGERTHGGNLCDQLRHWAELSPGIDVPTNISSDQENNDVQTSNHQLTEELLEIIDESVDENLLITSEEKEEVLNNSNHQFTEELLEIIDESVDENLLITSEEKEEVLNNFNHQLTEELLEMFDESVDENLLITSEEKEEVFNNSNHQLTEELLEIIDESVDENLLITSEEKEDDELDNSNHQLTEELLEMVDDSVDKTSTVIAEQKEYNEAKSANNDSFWVSKLSKNINKNSLTTTSPVEKILQSICTGNEETSIKKEPVILSEKTKQVSQPKIQSTQALPSIRVSVKQLDRLSHTIGELLISENQQHLQSDQIHRLTQKTLKQFFFSQQQLNKVRDWSDKNLLLPNSKRSQKKKRKNDRERFILSNSLTDMDSEFDVLEMDIYSDLHLLLQHLTEQMMQLGEQIESLEGLAQNFRFSRGKRQQLLSQAQDDLLEARMVPLATVFNRFPRLMQQMVASHQKPAQLNLIGAEVLIDKVFVEKLYEPLLHLIRNAYDHGIESVETRRQQGKPETGQITVEAYHQGNRITIEIRDDGQGLNWERIRQSAIEKQLLTPEQAANLLEEQLADLLFEPGFSTTEKISQLSGRGIGLDVVRSQFEAWQGSVSIKSNRGEGTTFILQLPLSFTTARLLVCESDGITYALLAEVIEQVVLPSPEQIQHQQQMFYCWTQDSKQELIPIYPLADLVNYQYPTLYKSNNSESLFPLQSKNSVKPLLMLKHNQQHLCLQVDQILVEQELVIKSLGDTLTLPTYIQGYSVLGNGNLTLVIEPKALVSQPRKTNLRASPFLKPKQPNERSPMTTILQQKNLSVNPEQTSPSGNSVQVLVVDDSVVQRRTLLQTLQKAGYQVLQAGNGQEALAQLNQHPEIKLIICDIEMPYMNGFEFLSHWKQDANFSQIPVIMVTTRSGKKHRQLALALGAKGYFTKPCSNSELLETIRELITQDQLSTWTKINVTRLS
ncbi:MAG: response regulator [Crocosphaera sp.]|nr:response regulator [Crocosphaera sp.]